jgi:hypothetical protein
LYFATTVTRKLSGVIVRFRHFTYESEGRKQLIADFEEKNIFIVDETWKSTYVKWMIETIRSTCRS